MCIHSLGVTQSEISLPAIHLNRTAEAEAGGASEQTSRDAGTGRGTNYDFVEDRSGLTMFVMPADGSRINVGTAHVESDALVVGTATGGGQVSSSLSDRNAPARPTLSVPARLRMIESLSGAAK